MLLQTFLTGILKRCNITFQIIVCLVVAVKHDGVFEKKNVFQQTLVIKLSTLYNILFNVFKDFDVYRGQGCFSKDSPKVFDFIFGVMCLTVYYNK